MHIISTVNMIELNVVPMLSRPMIDFALSDNDQFISVCFTHVWLDIYKQMDQVNHYYRVYREDFELYTPFYSPWMLEFEGTDMYVYALVDFESQTTILLKYDFLGTKSQ